MSRIWICGDFELSLETPLVMGVLNVTPDSFSDGGEFDDPLVARTHALRMIAEGAHIIDVGGESTRPGSKEVSPAEEISRVRPIMTSLADEIAVPLSIDTRHAEVARAAVEAGASIVNDVAGFRDPEMVAVALGASAGLVVMHMLGEPKTMQEEPRYDDVVDEVRGYLDRQAQALVRAGVAPERICVDPGIGFGKTLEDNLALLRSLPEIADLGFPVLVGTSRKRFIGEITGVTDPRGRLGGSIAAAAWAAAHGADIVRAHDVADTVCAVQVAVAIKGE
ncbi:MAG: dihydropteroate synthase [Actinomycetota bacterium]|nr:dihydropteroate synthase [Actinomycetota bacterium]